MQKKMILLISWCQSTLKSNLTPAENTAFLPGIKVFFKWLEGFKGVFNYIFSLLQENCEMIVT